MNKLKGLTKEPLFKLRAKSNQNHGSKRATHTPEPHNRPAGL